MTYLGSFKSIYYTSKLNNCFLSFNAVTAGLAEFCFLWLPCEYSLNSVVQLEYVNTQVCEPVLIIETP